MKEPIDLLGQLHFLVIYLPRFCFHFSFPSPNFKNQNHRSFSFFNATINHWWQLFKFLVRLFFKGNFYFKLDHLMGILYFSLDNSCRAETEFFKLKLLDNSEMEMKSWSVNPFFQKIFELEYEGCTYICNAVTIII